MKPRDSRTNKLLSELEEQFLSELEEEYLGRDGERPRIMRRISRRELLRSGAGTAVISAVGAAGLMELLANREAIAQGCVIALMGVTRDPIPGSETPHRHTFQATFTPTSISRAAIVGNVSGMTTCTFKTTSVEEDPHSHSISGTGVRLDHFIFSGTENGEPGEHVHQVSIE